MVSAIDLSGVSGDAGMYVELHEEKFSLTLY